jgi:hypothetical protein
VAVDFETIHFNLTKVAEFSGGRRAAPAVSHLPIFRIPAPKKIMSADIYPFRLQIAPFS